MNQNAGRLGLQNTHFVNATGLPDENHYTTPRDIARLTAALIAEFPELYRLYADKEYTWNNITQKNRNSLLWRDATVDGVKTGHTETAGYCLVASAERGGMRLISVVMGAESIKARAEATQSLLNYGFRFFETHPIYRAGESLVATRVWKGDREQVPLGLAEDLYVTIPRQQYDQLQAKTEIRPNIQAPVDKGESLGTVVIELNQETLAQKPLIALQGAGEGGIFRTLVDTVLMLFE
jgi:D-alanyl-D-alanine carboxypeptidase (penicillin-binding protein 5/6)